MTVKMPAAPTSQISPSFLAWKRVQCREG